MLETMLKMVHVYVWFHLKMVYLKIALMMVFLVEIKVQIKKKNVIFNFDCVCHNI